MKPKKPKKPKTRRELALYRARASCRIGMEYLNGETPHDINIDPLYWGLYNLLAAVKSLAEAMEESGNIARGGGTI